MMSRIETAVNLWRFYNCYIINNLVYGETYFSSNYTFYKSCHKSQDDIILANKAGLQSMKNFHGTITWLEPTPPTPRLLSYEISIEIDLLVD